MYIVYAKHDNCDKEFLFEVPPRLVDSITTGKRVLVETFSGKQVATATRSVSYIGQLITSNSTAEGLMIKSGAYLPLKKVIKVINLDDLSEAEKQEIVKEWLDKMLNNNTLPF